MKGGDALVWCEEKKERGRQEETDNECPVLHRKKVYAKAQLGLVGENVGGAKKKRGLRKGMFSAQERKEGD